MSNRAYAGEFKMEVINEYLAGGITLLRFVRERWISLSAFSSWLTKYRKEDNPIAKGSDTLVPIDVTKEAEGIITQRYFAHIRRESYGIAKVLPEGLGMSSAAAGMVRQIDALFAKEAEMKARGKTPLEIHRTRQSGGYMAIVVDVYVPQFHQVGGRRTPLGHGQYFRNVEGEAGRSSS